MSRVASLFLSKTAIFRITRQTYPSNNCSNNPLRYTDPTGHWQEGDEDLPFEDQQEIMIATAEWWDAYNAGNQEDMAKAQEALEDMTAEATSGGGAVTVVVTGKKQLKEIKINPEVVDPDDIEMLEDLIVAAVNEAIRKAEEINEAEMGKVTGGLGGLGGGIPGLF